VKIANQKYRTFKNSSTLSLLNLSLAYSHSSVWLEIGVAKLSLTS